MVKLKVYFAGSIRGNPANRDSYRKIISELKKKYTVLTEHVGDESALAKDELLSDAEIESRDIALIKDSDLAIAEVTNASHGVGIEICEAKHQKKLTICIYKKNDNKISAMISGCNHFKMIEYSDIESLLPKIDSIIGSHFKKS